MNHDDGWEKAPDRYTAKGRETIDRIRKGGGGLEKYLGVEWLKPYINLDNVLERMVAFR